MGGQGGERVSSMKDPHNAVYAKQQPLQMAGFMALEQDATLAIQPLIQHIST